MYGLIGKTLGHSFSPQLHQWMWGCDYRLLPMDEAAAEQFFTDRAFDGVNVTIPYKQLALRRCDVVDERAARIGAVNTVVNRDGRLYGYNTDYDGLTALLRRTGIELSGRKVLILGTGGTSHTAHAVAEDLGAGEIVTISRSGENNYGNIARHADAQVILNTTPVGMSPNAGQAAVDVDAFPALEGVADVVYNPLTTYLVHQARRRGVKAACGLAMLVIQAQKAAEYFAGRPIPDSAAEEALRRITAEQANLVLMGMPGCGKSTVGALVAQRLGRPFVDLDEEIVRAAGMSIPEIFAKDGETAFRDLESQVLREVSGHHGIVLSLGGGTAVREENRYFIRQNGPVFYLRRSIDVLSGEGRPLSKSPEAIRTLYDQRRGIYESVADITVDSVEGSAEETAERIVKEWETL